MPRNRKRDKAFPVGLFILLGMVILVGGILWLRNIAVRPSYTFTVAWRSPGQVNNGIAVYFRGVQVGRVTDVELGPQNKSTWVHIGITQADLRIPENSEIFVRLEGITGQRYIEINPPDRETPDQDYIADGELVWGTTNLTWEKIQEQLNRIAENRTLEKILNRTERAMQEFTLASQEWQQFSRSGQQLFTDVSDPSLATLNQIERSARQVEVAVGDFSRNTAGTDEALAAIRQASASVGGTFDTLQRQLVDTELIPNLSRTVTSVGGVSEGFQGLGETIRGQLIGTGLIPAWRQAATDVSQGMTGVRSDVSTGTRAIRGMLTGDPNEAAQLGRALASLNTAAQTLDRNLIRLRSQSRDRVLNEDLSNLRQLAMAIQIALDEEMSRPAGSPALWRQKRSLLETVGKQMSQTADRLAPVLRARIRQNAYQSPQAARNMLQAVESMAEIGRDLANQAGLLEPSVSPSGQGAPAGRGGLIGGIANAVAQVQMTAARFDCVARQMNDILDERFLGFKLFFGKPGAGYDCETPDTGNLPTR